MEGVSCAIISRPHFSIEMWGFVLIVGWNLRFALVAEGRNPNLYFTKFAHDLYDVTKTLNVERIYLCFDVSGIGNFWQTQSESNEVGGI
jgi:hypothetical protein